MKECLCLANFVNRNALKQAHLKTHFVDSNSKKQSFGMDYFPLFLKNRGIG